MNKNSIKGITLMLFCSLCLCLGQLIWKLMPGLHWMYLLSGFAVFGCGAVLMILAYRYGELSVLQPVNSMSYVYSLLLGYAVFHEEITFFRIIGVIAIMSGVLLLGFSNNT
jgi:undecaprenyl phosphate-alpha-L-ara4N flippase subunit ArnE